MEQPRVFKRFNEWLLKQGVPEINDLSEMRGRLDNMFGTVGEKYSWAIETIHDYVRNHDFDVIVSKERKGSNLFERYLQEKYVSDIHHIRFELIRPEDIKGANVLVFDDGIHFGHTMRRIVKKLKEYGAASIKVRALISHEESFKQLVLDFPDTDFDSAWKVPPEDYTVTYNRTFYRIFDQQHSPLDSHLEFTVHVRSIKELDDLIDAFQACGGQIYGIPTLEPVNRDVLKGTIVFEPSDIQFYPPVPESRIEMFKLRFYLHDEGGIGIKILMTPIVQLSNIDFEACSKNYECCNKILESKSSSLPEVSDLPPCLECCEYRTTVSLFYPIKDRFLAKLRERKVEVVVPSMRWTLAQKYGLPLRDSYLSP